jgi:hypothetical protein
MVNNENDNEDTEIGDDTLNVSDEEGEDGSDDEDQTDGEGQGDHDEDDAENAETKHLQLARTETNESADAADDHHTSQDRERDASSSPELPLAAMTSALGQDHGNAGSPLRNVVTFASAFEERSPELMSDGEAEAEGDEDESVHDEIQQNLPGEAEDSDMQVAYHMPQDQRFSAGHMGDGMPMEQNQGYRDDDEMLLDGEMSGMDFSNMAAVHDQYPEHYPDDEEEEIMSIPVQEQQDQIHHPDPQALDHFSAQDSIVDQPALGSAEEVREEEEDNFEDLLGSLEDHLNEQGSGIEGEQADDNAKLEEDVSHVPALHHFEVAPSVPEIVNVGNTVAHLTQGAAVDEKPVTEGDIVDVAVNTEAADGLAEISEASAPEPVAEG